MKRIVILGGGESGVGTAILAKKQGFEVFVSDFGEINPKYKQTLIENQIDWEEKTHTEKLILNADLVMKSPGIPDKSPIIKQLASQKTTIISEIEFAATYTNAVIIGITGSNGKTTTTMLTYHLLKNAGFNVGLGGNIGKSFAAQVANENFDLFVLELSSFQLDGIINFKPHIAVITNISPDHLDRYNYDYQQYIDSKFRITKNQTDQDYLIFDQNDEASLAWFSKNKTNAQILPFSITQDVAIGTSILNSIMKINTKNSEVAIDMMHFALAGKHNLKNAAAAGTIGHLLKVRKNTIKESFMNFQGISHRLENVLKIQNVQYINDSKATNVNATYYALECMTAPTVWIVGGVDKGNDYQSLMPLVFEKVKSIICLGVDNKKIIDAFGNMVDVMLEVDNMNDAVILAQRLAERGDNVLLSPCCSSFDLFNDYEDRGNQFIKAVQSL